MKRVYQTKYTNEKQRGDCFRAALASFLNKKFEDIPAFELMDDPVWVSPFVECLDRYGFEFFGLVHEMPRKDNRYYLASYHVRDSALYRGRVLRHAVIIRNRKIVHDPRRDPVELESFYCYYDIRKKINDRQISKS